MLFAQCYKCRIKVSCFVNCSADRVVTNAVNLGIAPKVDNV